jgi:hypothetical protein
MIVFVVGALAWSIGGGGKPLAISAVLTAAVVAFVFLGLFGGFGLGRRYSE